MSKFHNDERFKHVDYYNTDLAKTFARERKKIAEAAERARIEAEANEAEQAKKVRRIAK